jgi:hypothetical protein
MTASIEEEGPLTHDPWKAYISPLGTIRLAGVANTLYGTSRSPMPQNFHLFQMDLQFSAQVSG